MKFTIERAALLRTLAHIQSVVERRTTIPILSNVLLHAEGSLLSLTATDMDIAINESTSAAIGTEGSTTAPAHTLYDIVRKLPDGAQIEIGKEGDQLELRSGRSHFTLQTLPNEDFPIMSSGDMPLNFSISAQNMRRIIDRTRFAISTEETRYYLNGIYLHTTDNQMRAVATDGHRLAKIDMEIPEGATNMPGVIIPRKTVGELRKLTDEIETDIQISLSETKIRFAFDDVLLTSKLIDGAFPDYERVIPSGNDKMMQIDCRAFAEAVDRVSTIATEKMRAVKLAAHGTALTISASSQDNGSAVEEVEVGYDNDAIEIGFNSRYLLDIANQIESGQAQFEMADAASPTIVRDTEDTNALYVLMPMRV